MSSGLDARAARDVAGMRWREELLAAFADRLIAEWDSVPAATRDVWLRRRLDELVDSPRWDWRRRA